MPCPPQIARRLLTGALLLIWATGCASSPAAPGAEIDAKSSLLAVDVRFPVSLGRDPSLVNALLVRGPVHAGLEALPELVPATFVKGSRAYLLDPEPGTWSLVAVVSAYAPPRNRLPVAGVSDTVAGGGDIGNAVILPAEWIARTRTAVAPGRTAFMGSLSVHEGERIHAGTAFTDVLQERLADAVRPGATSQQGLAGRFSLSWTLDTEASSMRSGESARGDFLREAKLDLEGSAWEAFVPEVPPDAVGLATSWTKVTRPTPEPVAPPAPTAREPDASEPPSRASARAPETAPARAPAPAPTPTVPAPVLATTRTAPAPLEPAMATAKPEVGPAPAPATAGLRPLARIVPGMSHDDVREILGDPDERSSFITPRALIPFYSGPDTHRRTWTYHGQGRIEFSLNSRTGTLRVVRVESFSE